MLDRNIGTTESPESSTLSDVSFDIARSDFSNRDNQNQSEGDTSTPSSASSGDNEDLVVSDIYNDLGITGSGADQESVTEDSGSDNHWTVAIDFTGVLPEGTDPDHGAAGKSEQLKQLAEETQDSGVSFVVQAPHLENGVAVENQYDRYLIADGEIQLVAQQESEGMAEDLTDLLQAANTLAPSENLALVLQSHGRGADGVGTGSAPSEGESAENEQMSMDQLRDAIEKGLEGSEHQSLDLLDFDACAMASAAVLDTLHGVADNVVASEELEFESRDSFDAQNLNAVFEHLIENPSMDGETLAETFVDEARAGSNGEPVLDTTNGPLPHGGTSTLASFDMSNYEEFAGALETFGESLNNVMNNPANAETLSDLIEQTPMFPIDDPDRFGDRRDLDSFINQVDRALDAGLITDPDGSLDRATTNLDTELDQFREFFGEDTIANYDDMGGLYVYLPDQDSPTLIDNMAEMIENRGVDPRPVTAESLTRYVDGLQRLLSPEAQEQLAPLTDAISDFSTASGDVEKEQQLQNIQQILEPLSQGSVGDELRENSQGFIANSPRIENNEISLAPSWNEFVNRLNAS